MPPPPASLSTSAASSSIPNCPTGSVDSGAVQSNYALSFTAQQPSSVIADQTMSPAPIVTVTESGNALTAGSASVNVTDADNVLINSPATASTVSGEATFSALQFNTAETSDSLTATLALNPARPRRSASPQPARTSALLKSRRPSTSTRPSLLIHIPHREPSR